MCSAAAKIVADSRVTVAPRVRAVPVRVRAAPVVRVVARWVVVRVAVVRGLAVPVRADRVVPADGVRAARVHGDPAGPDAARWAQVLAVMVPAGAAPAARDAVRWVAVRVAAARELAVRADRAVAVRRGRVATRVAAVRRRDVAPSGARRIVVRRVVCPAWSAKGHRGACPACTMTTTSEPLALRD